VNEQSRWIEVVFASRVKFLAGPNGTVSGSIDQTIGAGAPTTAVTAVPAAGCRFVNWTGTDGFFSTANPLVVPVVSGDMTVTANFERVELRLGEPKLPWIVRRGGRFVVFGALRPGHTPKSKWVVLSFERKTSRGWRVVKRVTTRSYSIGAPTLKYAVRTRLYVRGRYRVRAYHPADWDGPATWSIYNTFLVR
ncbi:MAG: hypothetical protein Q7W16_09660, partial [Coriobacteriia bacterium]|nr:hypothetical protein [Coriobacteriia bacterium]